VVALPLLIRLVYCLSLVLESVPFQTHLHPWRNKQHAWSLPHLWWALPPCVAWASRSEVKQRIRGRWRCVLVLWVTALCNLVREISVSEKYTVSIFRTGVLCGEAGKWLPACRKIRAYCCLLSV
jgi:hypothetical protein